MIFTHKYKLMINQWVKFKKYRFWLNPAPSTNTLTVLVKIQYIVRGQSLNHGARLKWSHIHQQLFCINVTIMIMYGQSFPICISINLT